MIATGICAVLSCYKGRDTVDAVSRWWQQRNNRANAVAPANQQYQPNQQRGFDWSAQANDSDQDEFSIIEEGEGYSVYGSDGKPAYIEVRERGVSIPKKYLNSNATQSQEGAVEEAGQDIDVEADNMELLPPIQYP